MLYVRILSEILEGKMYDEDETQRILQSFPQNPVAAQIAYKFMQNNWQVIVTRYFATFLSFRQTYKQITMYSHVCLDSLNLVRS